MNAAELADLIAAVLDEHKYDHPQTSDLLSVRQFGSAVLVETCRSCSTQKFILRIEEAS